MNGGRGDGRVARGGNHTWSLRPEAHHFIRLKNKGMVRWEIRHTAAEGDKSPQPLRCAATQGSVREWVSESPWYCSGVRLSAPFRRRDTAEY
ncbi:hypothetical protein CLIM01_12525 [Colletotrichum limetticola]|uniref:Uncharacterized protein n=1 Tax=Colletotrichum limetticola TaxID=1209924 RepID=A0ABQ9PDH7_9PEZI|nr:hypothetical protein CLIM01_12525 [Colletotrichum limetticola]